MNGSWRRKVRMTGKKSLKEEKKKGRNRSHNFRGVYAGGGKHVPEKIEETEHLDQHTDSWPFQEDEEYPSEEAGRPT